MSASDTTFECVKTPSMASDNGSAGNTWTVHVGEAGICLRRADPASDAPTTTDSTRSGISGQAGDGPSTLVIGDAPIAQLLNAAGVLPSVIDALRDAPNFTARFSAAHVLAIFAEARPAQRRAIAEAGVMGLLLELFIEAGNMFLDLGKTAPGWNLARVLLSKEPVAVRDLRRAISGPRVDVTFKALVFLQVRHSCSLSLRIRVRVRHFHYVRAINKKKGLLLLPLDWHIALLQGTCWLPEEHSYTLVQLTAAAPRLM